MLFHNFLNIDLYNFVNGQLFAALIGAIVTILGVWLTINDDRKSRIVERRNEIKPIFSMSFIGIEDDVKLKKNVKCFINKNTFSYMPILQFAQSFLTPSFITYSDSIGIDTPFKRETFLIFEFHVDANYPIKNVEVTGIKTVKNDKKGYIKTDRPISIGPSPKVTDDMFNFYHKTNPNNFEISNKFGIRHWPLDIRMLNVYISPGETVYFKVPINIGYANLSSLIRFICKDPNFKLNGDINYNYLFDNPDSLDTFLENMYCFPIQVNIRFEITDIDDNVYDKEWPAYAFFDIRKISNGRDNKPEDYFISGGMSTNSTFPREIEEIRGLKNFIYEQFKNIKNKGDTIPK